MDGAVPQAGFSWQTAGMFLNFFTSLRDAQVPVTLREYLTLLEALDHDLADMKVEQFYYLARTLLVKDEQVVRKGQKIAEMGSSDAERVQLHFEIRRLGIPIDPLRLLPPR